MDLNHPGIQAALAIEEDDAVSAAHEGDSALYVRLAMAAMDINEACQRIKQDVDRLGLMMGTAMLDIESHRQAHHITGEQRDRLLYLLKEGIDEPTEDNDVPVYAIRFPGPHDEPPRAA